MKFIIVNFEVKNELKGMNTEPTVQNIRYYAHFVEQVLQKTMNFEYKTFSFPALLVMV